MRLSGGAMSGRNNRPRVSLVWTEARNSAYEEWRAGPYRVVRMGFGLYRAYILGRGGLALIADGCPTLNTAKRRCRTHAERNANRIESS